MTMVFNLPSRLIDFSTLYVHLLPGNLPQYLIYRFKKPQLAKKNSKCFLGTINVF